MYLRVIKAHISRIFNELDKLKEFIHSILRKSKKSIENPDMGFQCFFCINSRYCVGVLFFVFLNSFVK